MTSRKKRGETKLFAAGHQGWHASFGHLKIIITEEEKKGEEHVKSICSRKSNEEIREKIRKLSRMSRDGGETGLT